MVNTIVNIPDIIWKDTNTMFNYKFFVEERIETIVMFIIEKSLHQ